MIGSKLNKNVKFFVYINFYFQLLVLKYKAMNPIDGIGSTWQFKKTQQFLKRKTVYNYFSLKCKLFGTFEHKFVCVKCFLYHIYYLDSHSTQYTKCLEIFWECKPWQLYQFWYSTIQFNFRTGTTNLWFYYNFVLQRSHLKVFCTKKKTV